MPEFRDIPEDRIDEFQSMVRYAFRPEQGPTDDDGDSDGHDTPESERIGQAYGLFEDDDLRAVCRLIEFDTRVRGRTHPLDGLSAVASPPETRRQGFTSQLLHDALVESRERESYLSALWPFKRSFYANYGWATSNRGVHHECDPDALSFTRDHRHGEFVQLDADDWERLAAVHDEHGAPYELTMNRTEAWWRKRVFQGWRDDPYVYGWERDGVSASTASGVSEDRSSSGCDESSIRNSSSDERSESDGDLAAYLAYGFDSDDERALHVRDWAFVDHDARLALLRFLANHDSQVEQVAFWSPEGDDFLDLFPDTDDVEVTVRAGPMFRLVDVPVALEALAFPGDVTTDLVLDVSDPLADWNDDTHRVAVDAGEATVDSTTDDPDARLGVDALSQLYVGYRSATELATVGAIQADDATVDELDAVFPERDPLMREGF
jgi:predicted acetyltransferase